METVGSWSDITERKLLEDQLRQSQKMEAIGQLAGGVAHDFNNLLTVMNGYAEIVMSSLPAENPHKGLLAEVVKAGNRASSLTSQLLAFSRKQILAPKVLNLNDVVENAEKMLRRMIGEDVLLVTAYDTSLNHVKVDPGQVEQVIVNLAINARDAMPQGGTLTIGTCNIDLDEEQCLQYPGCKPGSYVAITMTDTGSGMTPEVKARIFEPFYTTKEVGKGTGLGLAMVYGIVKQSDGYIAVDTTVGVGTTFKIFLPCVSDTEDSSRPDDGETLPRRGNETVLLVEDEEGVRKLARLILEMHGYKVLEASSGREAINLENTHVGPIHLLITDVVMPEISGRQLVESLLPRHQGLKVLYMSGYTDDAIVRHGVMDASDSFLQKPFSLPSLAKKVRDVLDGRI
jgi:nitrogen-specific signal transduction histidine kinase